MFLDRLPRFIAPGLPVLLTVVVTTWLLASLLASGGLNILELVLLALHPLLIGWGALACWEQLVGGLRLLRRPGTDAFARHRQATANQSTRSNDADADRPSATVAPIGGHLQPRTAVIMPIYQEDITRTFAGMRATIESIAAQAGSDAFEFFILSDCQDPETVEAQKKEYERLRSFSYLPVFYRARQGNVGRKAGNVRDFIETWGGRYDYVVVLDADSVMGGSALVRMVETMQARPALGLLQSQIRYAFGRSIFARATQYGHELFGAMKLEGMRSWIRRDGNFYGHNAIFRTRAFAQHCGLPILPGKAPFGGYIQSHDTLEATLLRRGGWEVEIWEHEEASFEETPPNAIENMKIERRWCQGTMQISRLSLAAGLPFISRVLVWLSAIEYLMGPILLTFSGLGLLAGLATHYDIALPLIASEKGIRSVAGVEMATAVTWLLSSTLFILLSGRILALALAFKNHAARRDSWHRYLQTTGNVLAEFVFSVFTSPSRSLCHTFFVWSILRGRAITWNPASRFCEKVTVKEAMGAYRKHMVFGAALLTIASFAGTVMFLWALPLGVPLLLSPFICAFTSRNDVGDVCRNLGLFETGDERVVPAEVARTEELTPSLQRPRTFAPLKAVPTSAK